MAHTLTTVTGSSDAPDAGTPAPWLFVVCNAGALLAPPSRHRLDGVAEVRIGRGTAPPARTGRALALELDDDRVSTAHARLERVLHHVAIEDLGSRNGTRVNGVKVTRAQLADGDVIEVGRTFLRFRMLTATPDAPADAVADPGAPPGLATLRPDLAEQLARLELVARSRETVMILGETGTGKELVARAVHARSGRAGELVAVNCGALPEAMVEAELFGHRRGAFSGATSDRDGLVRSADGGTLFLDEIGDLRLGSQAALLRVLQEQQVTPVGGDRPTAVDLRVVCATHQPLDALVADGRFRADLYARLRGFAVTLPPLRERREDLGLIVAAIVRARAGDAAATTRLSSGAARALLAHDWPHNIRELEKALGAALALAGGGRIERAHLPGLEPALAPPPADDAGGAMTRERLVALLREHDGNLAAVARAAGRGRTQVHRWLARFSIDPNEYRS